MNSVDWFEKILKIVQWPWGGITFSAGVAFFVAVISSAGITLFFELKPAGPLKGDSTLQLAIPVSTVTLQQPDLIQIVKRNLFNKEGEVPDKDFVQEEKTEITQARVKSKLPLVLHGTIFSGDQKNGVATIEDTNRQSIGVFVVGDVLAADTEIKEIWQDKVIFWVRDHEEYIELIYKDLPIRRAKKNQPNTRSATAPVPALTGGPMDSFIQPYKEEGFERSGTEILISQDFRKKMLTTDFAKMLQDAKAEPHVVGGELAGFRLTRIRPDSIYEKSGLLDDDIIKEINGVALTSASQAVTLLNSLKEETNIEVRLERSGQMVTVSMRGQP
jgi:type II secretion system protein C